jgi:cytochrome b6-f complex iron-sulfur subunit
MKREKAMTPKKMECKECTEAAERTERTPSGPAADQSRGARQLSRRNFLKMGIGALGALAVLEAGAAGVMFLQARSMAGTFGGIVTAGPTDKFPLGSVTEFVDAGFFLIRSHEGGFLAVSRRCPHLGCTVDWEPEQNRFRCPCHASTFDFYGNHENPPVPRPLDTFVVQIENEAVVVDTSAPQRREQFEPQQLIHA